MPFYASYDPSIAVESPVTGWYDTDAFQFSVWPPPGNLLLLTPEQWAAHTTGLWVVTGGSLVSHTPVLVLTLAQQADAELARRLDVGLAVTSETSPDLNVSFALDPTSTAQVFQIGLYASQFGVFPSGDTTLQYPDRLGMPRMFTVPQFVAFLRAVAPLVSRLNMAAGMMKAGAPPSWPDQTAAIP